MGKTTYKDAGVDLDVYEQSMARLPQLMRRSHSPRAMRLDGGFAGLFQLDFQNPLFRRNYRDPVLVSCTDGVGTKLKVATIANKHDTVGIDLVAMSINDAICCGAEPLFFLDYVAMSHDDPDRLEQIVKGISDGCVESGCALLGGETAIMPDIYAPGEYDLAGFCVGVAERDQLITGKAIAAGDVILGLASNGLHSNGYSLVRKIVFEIAGLDVSDHVEELGETVGDTLLRPTRIYAKTVQDILAKNRDAVHGIAHITGGGLEENLSRILPDGTSLKIQPDSWAVPQVFTWLQRIGDIEDSEMARVFNMGLGLALVVDKHEAAAVKNTVGDCGTQCWEVGEIAVD
ncbi:MAG: phosphoribosylformylglycinamidine cyclo-ligase [Planctomycetales bacterium]|nr:phosphoribosylformylglycinamidine cyclo-ligase [Planctomycetales bacterium]